MPIYFYIFFVTLLMLVHPFRISAQNLAEENGFTRQDTLRGSITPERAWWDVLKYKLNIIPGFAERSIRGSVGIVYKVTDYRNQRAMQIDLQQPMNIDSIIYRRITTQPGRKEIQKESVSFNRDGNVYYLKLPVQYQSARIDSIEIFFSGLPRIAVNPPWDGGWIFTEDAKGRPWMTVACQGLGASVWYPCKDHQSDEPDQGAIIQIFTAPDLVAVANGRLINRKKTGAGITWSWLVKNPINNYNIVPYIGKYVHWSDRYIGEKKKVLSLDYWVLDYNLAKSKKQFGRDVKPMLKSFEFWFGPFPFYEDGYKLVETPHLGMEHQSGIAYGNHYMNGYLGMDLSNSGWGKKWDYIIIHESGHEWFANNITTNDIADMWVHEGFTMYSEVLFVESLYGKKAANEYCQGLRNSIENDKPLIGPYGVNREGSGDMYNKGANLIHTIRQLIGNDSMFRRILRGMNTDFHLQTIDSRDVERYISRHARKDFSKVFDQYLRTSMIPTLEYKIEGYVLSFRWTNTVDGFNMPLKIREGLKEIWIHPTAKWQRHSLQKGFGDTGFSVNPNFYILTRKV